MDKPEKPKDQEKKPIADVEEPGKSAPASTSKPVLVTNRPVLQDPMVVGKNNKDGDETGDEKPTEKRELKRTGAPTIQPLDTPDTDDSPVTAATEADKPEVDPTAPEAEKPAEPSPPEEPADEPVPAENEKPSPETPPSDKHGTITGSDQGKPTTDAERKLQAEASMQAKHDEAIQKLVDEGQYVLPINTVEKRKAKNFVVLGVVLAIALVLAWLDIALDAHILNLGGVHPVTHLFSN